MPEPEQTEQVAPQAATTTPAPAIEMFDGEPFDAARAKALIEKQRALIKELQPKAKQAEELSAAEQKRKEAEMTELQKMQSALEKAQAELKAAKISELKRGIAAKVELPLIFADRLQGNTPEELEADAKKILEALPKVPKPPNIGATNPGAGASQGKTDAQRLAELHGQTVPVFDANWAKSHGGGVIMQDKTLTTKE